MDMTFNSDKIPELEIKSKEKWDGKVRVESRNTQFRTPHINEKGRKTEIFHMVYIVYKEGASTLRQVLELAKEEHKDPQAHVYVNNELWQRCDVDLRLKCLDLDISKKESKKVLQKV